MSNRMPEIQEGTPGRALALILLYDVLLNLYVCGKDTLNSLRLHVPELFHALFKEPEELLVCNGCMLDDFSKAVEQLMLRQGFQEIYVCNNQPRLPESPDKVLAIGSINPDFPTYTGINHRKQGCGQLDVWDAAEVRCCDEACKVACDPSAQCSHECLP